jgi:Flp pilus assembly protein TadG
MAKKNSSGQSLVEFALIIPLLLLLVMGTVDFGRVFYIKIALQSAAREGAYYLSYNPTDASFTNTKQAIKNEANNLGVQVNDADININGCSPCVSGSPVQVIVRQTVNLMIFNFMTGPLNLTSQARMMVQ